MIWLDGTGIKMTRILITGGAGFVGSSLALRFRSEWPSAEIVCLDNLSRNGSALNRERIEEAGIGFLHRDVRNAESFELDPFDVVIDAAAEPSVLAGQDGDSKYVVDTNLCGTLNVLEACKKWSSALLFISTSRVYPLESLRAICLEEGEKRLELSKQQDLPGVSDKGISEEFPIEGSRTLYGATKYASEVMVQEYAAQFGMKCIIDRCGVLAGPWQMGKVDQGVIALWVAAHHYGMKLRYIGFGGKQVRDALHIDDFSDLVVTQLNNRDMFVGERFNVGGGRAVSFSLLELTGMVEEVRGGAHMEIPADPKVRHGDIPLYITDASKARHKWDWDPSRSLKDIVVDTEQWVRSNERALQPVLGL